MAMIVSKDFMLMRINVYNEGELILNGTMQDFLVDNSWDEEVLSKMETFQVDGNVEFVEWDSKDGNWKVCKYLEVNSEHDEQIWQQGFQDGKKERERSLMDSLYKQISDIVDPIEIKTFIKTKWEEYVIG